MCFQMGHKCLWLNSKFNVDNSKIRSLELQFEIRIQSISDAMALWLKVYYSNRDGNLG